MVINSVWRQILSVLAEKRNMTRIELAEMLADEQYIEYDARSGDVVLRKEQWIRSLLREK